MPDNFSYLADLPPELINLIYEELNVHDQLSLAETCQYTKSIYENIVLESNFDARKHSICKSLFESKRSMLLIGPGGTGKTTVAKYVADQFKAQNKAVVRIAPTHNAAHLIPGATTIHAYLGIRKTYSAEDMKRIISERWKAPDEYAPPPPDLIIVDEISMLGAKLFECMDIILRWRHATPRTPLAGITFLFCGDFCQLPPVFDAPVFTSSLWQSLCLQKVELVRSLRQSGDTSWFRTLNALRKGEFAYMPREIMDREIDRTNLDAVYEQEGSPPPTILSANNDEVECINKERFYKNPNPISRTYHAEDTYYWRITTCRRNPVTNIIRYPEDEGIMRVPEAYTWNCQKSISVKVGAVFVITQNINPERGLFNGMRCVYKGLGEFELQEEQEGDKRVVSSDELMFSHIIPLPEYGTPDRRCFLRRKQLAIRMAYAITTHRSQGMTISNLVIDCSSMNSLAQWYVALSRSTGLSGIKLMGIRKDDQGRCKLPRGGLALEYLGYKPTRRRPVRNRKRKRSAEEEEIPPAVSSSSSSHIEIIIIDP